MAREAAIMGTPAYSLFAGKPGALDAALERDGRLTILRTIEEVRNLRFEKNARAFRSNSADARTGEVILQHIIALGKPTAKRVPPLGQMQPSLPGSRSDDTP